MTQPKERRTTPAVSVRTIGAERSGVDVSGVDVSGVDVSGVDVSGDAVRVVALQNAAFSQSWNLADMRRILAIPGAIGLIAEADSGDGGGPAVGFVVVQRLADQAEIISIAVAESWRGHGVGERLMRAAMASAIVVGACEMFLEVAEDNMAALALYSGLGFEVVGRRSKYYSRSDGTRADALSMCRVLVIEEGEEV
ncbi:MAG: GNAT family N-acetyltransferase [Rhodospirillaceae bacterium]|nr:GNAT family N-acetyltransferase [Rhodospirillaceae bacterium]